VFSKKIELPSRNSGIKQHFKPNSLNQHNCSPLISLINFASKIFAALKQENAGQGY